jgi:hypothetical protein
MGPIKGTASPDLKNAFHAMAKRVMAATADTQEVQVDFGTPGSYAAWDIIKIGRVSARQDPATLGTNRSREQSLEIEVTISCYRGGGADQEQVCSDRAYQLLRLLADEVHHGDTTLGGVVRWCFLASDESDGATDPADVANGRTIAIVATFAAAARITN